MILSSVNLVGFRNFKNSTVNFSEKSLLIGENDIGKSNLIYALRLLLDKSISDNDLEPRDSDFYVHEATSEFKITIELSGVTEDCVLSKLRGHVSEGRKTYLRYIARRDLATGKLDYSLLVGKSEESLEEIDGRFYLKVLNLKFVGSRRDLKNYISKEKKRLLQDAKGLRDKKQIDSDDGVIQNVAAKVSELNENINTLSYISGATKNINTELKNLSYKNTDYSIEFEAGSSDTNSFVDNLNLVSKVNSKSLGIGGDGRNNQIHLSLWAASNHLAQEDEEPLEVSIFCIEEPEAHLHPHQQRKLAAYLYESIKAQVIITSHSPQIVCEFPPETLIRLFNNCPDTLAAGNGVNPIIEKDILDFGFRLNLLPAEAFFSSVIFLVEGPSEIVFYKALAQQIGIDLDRYNISILMVNGVGFTPFTNMLKSLQIPYVIRTDNDVMKIPHTETYRYAGVERGISLCPEKVNWNPECTDKLRGFNSKEDIPKVNSTAANTCIKYLQNYGVYLSNIDLENDLYDALPEPLNAFTEKGEKVSAVKSMQKKKATGMFDFIRSPHGSLISLAEHILSMPLKHCVKIVEGEE